MAVTQEQVTDKAADPSQSPAEIVVDADAVTGITAALQEGIDTDTGGEIVHFGFAGAVAPVDDATFVPGGNEISANSQFAPGQLYSVGYQNEALVKEGVVTEANLIIRTRPDEPTPDVKTVMGLA